MGFLNLVRNLSNSEGARESVRMSYRKHYRLASRSGADPHSVGLFGALASRRKAAGRFNEGYCWMEVAPFLCMAPEDGREALAEYIVCLERPEEGKIGWLRTHLNNALRTPYSSEMAEEARRMAADAAKLSSEAFPWIGWLDDDVAELLGVFAIASAAQSTIDRASMDSFTISDSPEGEDGDDSWFVFKTYEKSFIEDESERQENPDSRSIMEEISSRVSTLPPATSALLNIAKNVSEEWNEHLAAAGQPNLGDACLIHAISTTVPAIMFGKVGLLSEEDFAPLMEAQAYGFVAVLTPRFEIREGMTKDEFYEFADLFVQNYLQVSSLLIPHANREIDDLREGKYDEAGVGERFFPEGADQIREAISLSLDDETWKPLYVGVFTSSVNATLKAVQEMEG